jgi:hypothetical protein
MSQHNMNTLHSFDELNYTYVLLTTNIKEEILIPMDYYHVYKPKKQNRLLNRA